ncbi:hypothetical protein IPZ58_06460 [Streptomyces roseoverticillatus]|uniref:hypothetical protein n=1 Tax=Streptomyces roseoverticillatus TaxID=66429 RepID=UPI001F229D30|nr:hypothetical protein [Streptomyces roseoverticillatus]MCF3101222.1 hypothetical protein [Streptomyces roseoverticillatus]
MKTVVADMLDCDAGRLTLDSDLVNDLGADLGARYDIEIVLEVGDAKENPKNQAAAGYP